MSGKKIIDGLKDAVAGNFSRVTIDGQVWERIDTRAQLSAPADGKESGESGEAWAQTMLEIREFLRDISTGAEITENSRDGATEFVALLDVNFAEYWASPQAAVDQAGQDYFNAIDQSLVVRHLGVAAGNPLEELDAILSWEVSVALDPRVSSAAQALIDSGGAQAGKMIEALEKIAYAPPGGVGPTLRESIEIARAALSAQPAAPQAAMREALLLDVFKAASVYYGCYVQDEAEELECCISHEQHEAAKALRDALRAALSAQSAVPSETCK